MRWIWLLLLLGACTAKWMVYPGPDSDPGATLLVNPENGEVRVMCRAAANAAGVGTYGGAITVAAGAQALCYVPRIDQFRLLSDQFKSRSQDAGQHP